MATARRLGLGILPLLFLAGTIVMLFLLILAGEYGGRPLNQISFLQADTRGIPGAPNGIARWTLYNVCNPSNVNHYDCLRFPTFSLLPQTNFNTRVNVPQGFLDHPGRYDWLTFSLFGLYLVDFGLALVAFLAGVMGEVRLAGVVTGVTLMFAMCSAGVMTACYVMAMKAFQESGRFARVGVIAFSLTWTCVASLYISMVLLCRSAPRPGVAEWEEDSRVRYTPALRRNRVQERDGRSGRDDRLSRKEQRSSDSSTLALPLNVL